MNDVLREEVGKFHTSGQKFVYEFAGAGSQALTWLHSVAGSSQTILEATDRYSARSLEDLLGSKPDKVVAEVTACAMAKAASRRLPRVMGEAVIGLAVTAAIATDRDRKGKDQAYIYKYWPEGQSVSIHIEFEKGVLNRTEQEEVVSGWVIHALISKEHAYYRHSERGHKVSVLVITNEFANLLSEWSTPIMVSEFGEFKSAPASSGEPIIVIPGSFDPIHQGHLELMEAAKKATGIEKAYFEITISNADKDQISCAEAMRRALLISGQHGKPVIISRLRLIVDKANFFRMAVFAVGYDTASRILDPKYYGSFQTDLEQMLCGLKHYGARLAVMGRYTQEGFKDLNDLPMVQSFNFKELFIPLSGRVDISSTQLRLEK